MNLFKRGLPLLSAAVAVVRIRAIGATRRRGFASPVAYKSADDGIHGETGFRRQEPISVYQGRFRWREES